MLVRLLAVVVVVVVTIVRVNAHIWMRVALPECAHSLFCQSFIANDGRKTRSPTNYLLLFLFCLPFLRDQATQPFSSATEHVLMCIPLNYILYFHFFNCFEWNIFGFSRTDAIKWTIDMTGNVCRGRGNFICALDFSLTPVQSFILIFEVAVAVVLTLMQYTIAAAIVRIPFICINWNGVKDLCDWLSAQHTKPSKWNANAKAFFQLEDGKRLQFEQRIFEMPSVLFSLHLLSSKIPIRFSHKMHRSMHPCPCASITMQTTKMSQNINPIRQNRVRYRYSEPIEFDGMWQNRIGQNDAANHRARNYRLSIESIIKYMWNVNSIEFRT